MTPTHIRSLLRLSDYAGNVCLELVNGDGSDTVKVTYDTTGSDYCLDQVQAYVGDSIPVGKTGNPTIGLFPAKNTTMPAGCVKTATVSMLLTPGCVKGAEFMDRIYKVAAHR